jgi:hypothetical protein
MDFAGRRSPSDPQKEGPRAMESRLVIAYSLIALLALAALAFGLVIARNRRLYRRRMRGEHPYR